MRAKQPRKPKIPATVMKRLGRELAAFGPDLRIPSDRLAFRSADQLLSLPGNERSRTPASGTRMVLSLGAGPEGQSWWDRKRDALLKRAADLRDSYRNNPYIEVKGFSIELGLSPSLTIDFEFK